MSDKPKWTPGPWQAGAVMVSTAYGMVDVSALSAPGGMHNPGNARLIAAAPKMAEALKEIILCFNESHADEVANDHAGDGSEGCSYCAALAEARAALREAGLEDARAYRVL